MIKSSAVCGSIATVSVLLGITSSGAIAQMSHEMPSTEPTGEFHRIDQPLWVKGAVTVGGLGLIGLELWWFVFNHPRSE
ncbi:hypothetical protein ACN4EK_00035 [Pantanalinema rosaneae CENA516]|uniref:hypothetical protein n=1 Tax=Pantanalinema rosaneae TaxID=1620701 RepID=UPI003D6EA6B4